MNTSKKIIIVCMTLGCIVAAYVYISQSTKSEAASKLSSLLSSNSDSLNSDSEFNQQLVDDTAFLSTLVTLKKIKIDTTIFNNDLFKILSDNAVVLEKGEPGRSNPFASIGIDDSIKTPVPQQITVEAKNKVETGDATKVTTKTAVLNGSVTTDKTSLNSYFEFGTTELLENKTPQVIKTQAGTYATNLTGLQSKTVYYFRAVSVINGAILSGEVKSFMTN